MTAEHLFRSPLTSARLHMSPTASKVVHFVLALRRAMSIREVAQFTGLNWGTVKEIEKNYLRKKYKKVRLGDVQ